MGLWAKCPFFPLPPSRRVGEAHPGRRRRPSPATQGTTLARVRGKRERGPWETQSPSQFVQR